MQCTNQQVTDTSTTELTFEIKLKKIKKSKQMR